MKKEPKLEDCIDVTNAEKNLNPQLNRRIPHTKVVFPKSRNYYFFFVVVAVAVFLLLKMYELFLFINFCVVAKSQKNTRCNLM